MAIPANLARRFVGNALTLRLSKRTPVRPLLLAYFVTFRCNLRCFYCEYRDGDETEEHRELATGESLRILRICREGVPAVAFSGGEPLLRDDISFLVDEAKKLRYSPISLFTNGLKLPEKDEVLDSLDYLQISMDSLDERRQDSIFGTGRVGQAKELKRIITHYARQQERRKFRINVNAILTPDHPQDVLDVLDFARSVGVRFTVCPQLARGQPVPGLRGNSVYRATVERLREIKRRDSTLMDAGGFLTSIRSFEPYRCHPYLAPRVFPDGSLSGPCPVLRRVSLNVLEIGSWKGVWRQLVDHCGVRPACARPCFLPCYLETSMLMNRPLQALRELWHLGNHPVVARVAT